MKTLSVLCAWCQLYHPVNEMITRFYRWFCDQDCADAWERVHPGGH